MLFTKLHSLLLELDLVKNATKEELLVWQKAILEAQDNKSFQQGFLKLLGEKVDFYLTMVESTDNTFEAKPLAKLILAKDILKGAPLEQVKVFLGAVEEEITYASFDSYFIQAFEAQCLAALKVLESK